VPPSPDEWAARVAADPGLRDALRAARMWRVSPSRFSGHEPAVRHIADAAGRVIRSESEPEWSDDDRAAVFALIAWEADLCPGCHQPLAETTGADNEDQFAAGLAVRCHYCTAAAQGAEGYEKSPQPSALMIPVHRRP
jgi:hypothetical protein